MMLCCAASTTRLTFSMAYSPPETLHAVRAGEHTITSDPSADIWAIGVITYELVLGRPAFPARAWSREQLTQAARGQLAYPWEEPDQPGRFRHMPEARALSGALRACLNRRAARRPTAAALGRRFNHLFDDHGATSESTPCTRSPTPKLALASAATLAHAAEANAEDFNSARSSRIRAGVLPGSLDHSADASPTKAAPRPDSGVNVVAWPGAQQWTAAAVGTESTEAVEESAHTGRTRHIFHDVPEETPLTPHLTAALSSPQAAVSPVAPRAESDAQLHATSDRLSFGEVYRGLRGLSSTESMHAADALSAGPTGGVYTPGGHYTTHYTEIPPVLMPTSIGTNKELSNAVPAVAAMAAVARTACAVALSSQREGRAAEGRGSTFSGDVSTQASGPSGSFLR